MYSQERAASELRPEGSTGGKRGSGQADAQQIEWSGKVFGLFVEQRGGVGW